MKLIRPVVVFLALLFPFAPRGWAIEAYRLAPGERIALDGNLEDAAWAKAPLLDRFYEISPRDQVDASVRSEARFAYDGQAL